MECIEDETEVMNIYFTTQDHWPSQRLRPPRYLAEPSVLSRHQYRLRQNGIKRSLDEYIVRELTSATSHHIGYGISLPCNWCAMRLQLESIGHFRTLGVVGLVRLAEIERMIWVIWACSSMSLFVQATSVAHNLVWVKGRTAPKRGVLLRSSCDSDGGQMMFLSMQSVGVLDCTSGLDNTDLMIGRFACEGNHDWWLSDAFRKDRILVCVLTPYG